MKGVVCGVGWGAYHASYPRIVGAGAADGLGDGEGKRGLRKARGRGGRGKGARVPNVTYPRPKVVRSRARCRTKQ